MKLSDIRPGTLIRGKLSGDVYIVTGNYGTRLTAVRSVDVTHPPEWDVVHPQAGPPTPFHTEPME